MGSYTGTPDRTQRGVALAGVVAVHALLAVVILSGLNVRAIRHAVESMTTIEVRPPPPPPPPPPTRRSDKAERKEGAAGRKAEPTPVVAPKPRLPVPSPIAAAPVAGTGSASSAGAATAGSGTGAGGSGSGRGGGGAGLAANPRLLSGGPMRSDYRALGARIDGPTQATMQLTISVEGRVSACRVVASTGYADVDARICPFYAQRMHWAPARGADGQPVVSWTMFVVRLRRY
jgi:protein TonB